jgi:hypothetical protein
MSNSADERYNNQTGLTGPTGGKNLRVLEFHRTVSMDAIHTGGKGHVRSHQWLKESNLRQFNNGKQLNCFLTAFL